MIRSFLIPAIVAAVTAYCTVQVTQFSTTAFVAKQALSTGKSALESTGVQSYLQKHCEEHPTHLRCMAVK